MFRTSYLLFLVATVVELILAIVLLSLFACAYPDRYRTTLWQNGGTNGWNSDPHERVYDYANYRESPHIPLIWDESCTLCNLCIAVVTMFLWVVRFKVNFLSRHSLDLYATITVNAVYDVISLGLWIYSAVAQSSGDLSDPSHISLRPWYLDRGCEGAWPWNRGACEVMKASYGFSIFAA
ncbi:hypothetical protein EJ02DRAFT_479542 [Clathrospora elynae]|uniref:MARVEL domain-containing protein n=1 Tax=Clathrospora elynae TaxID=706981 RepID=A0A6A5SYJ4_9PLEO|nr:hypothetical protein EJ02DRAFT_479542 [Clathrospora elynae]